MIGLFRKKGFGTAVGIASVSLMSAGLLGTNMYQNDNTNQSASIEATQILSLVHTINQTLILQPAIEPYRDGVAETEVPVTPPTTPPTTEFKPLPVPSNPNLPLGIFTEAVDITYARLYFAHTDHKCSTHYPQNGLFSHAATRPNLPCNVFRIRGPLGTKITPHDSSNGNGAGSCIPKTTCIKIIEDTSKPNAVISIPIQYSYLHSNYKQLMSIIRNLQTSLAAVPEINIFIYKKTDSSTTNAEIAANPYKPDTNVGTSISNLLPNNSSGCNTLDEKCSLIITISPPAAGAGNGTCTTCLSVKGSNSMNGAITFNKSDVENKPLITWDAGGKEQPINAQVVAGFTLSNKDLTLKLPSGKKFTIGAGLTVDGETVLNQGLTVEKNATIKEDLTVEKNATIKEDLTVEKNAKIKDTLYMNKDNDETYFKIDGNNDLNIATPNHLIVKSDLLADKALSVRLDLSVGTDITSTNTTVNDAIYMNKEGYRSTSFEIDDATKDLKITTPNKVLIDGDARVEKDLTVGGNFTTKTLNITDNLVVGNKTTTKDLKVTNEAEINLAKIEKIKLKGNPLEKMLPGLALQDVLPTPIGARIYKPNCPTNSWPAIFVIPLTVPNQVQNILSCASNNSECDARIPVVNLYHIYPFSYSTYWEIRSQTGSYTHLKGSAPIVYSQIYCDNRTIVEGL